MHDSARRPATCSDISVDTHARVEKACSTAGFPDWSGVVAECCRGTLLRIEFAKRRPVSFVKEFAALVRESELKLGADRNLHLYLGAPASMRRLQQPDLTPSAYEVVNLGAIDPEEEPDIPVSASARSAGLTPHVRTERIQRLPDRSVLILDDDAVSRKVLSAALTHAQWQVQAVGEAEAAFSILREMPIELVVLDIVLGGTMDGFEFCRAMRGNARFANIPVIFVTGYPAEHPKVKAEGVPASAYFEKPVKPAKLRDMALRLVNSGPPRPAQA